MGIVKVHRYGGRIPEALRVSLSKHPEKPVLRVANPPEFRNGIPGVWSPEELLVGSLAARYELTGVAIAEYKGVPLHAIRIDATGHVERKDAGTASSCSSSTSSLRPIAGASARRSTSPRSRTSDASSDPRSRCRCRLSVETCAASMAVAALA
jgi:organic hydroperoxide reductase OsmC/OhrA